MDSLSNDELVLLNKKQEAAFDVVFRLFFPRLVYFAREYVSYDDAKNAAQDAFVALWKSKTDFSNEAQLQSYLYTSVKNNCLLLLRHEKVKGTFAKETNEKKKQLYISALNQLDTSEVTFFEIESLITKTLSELPPRCKAIFELSRFDGKRNSEIAESLDISVKSVEAQITKALKIFKNALKDYLPLVAYIMIVNRW